MCPYAMQRDRRDKILCTKTAGICGHVYFCQLSDTWKLSRGSETCALAKKKEKEPEPVEIEKAVEKKATTRRKAVAKK